MKTGVERTGIGARGAIVQTPEPLQPAPETSNAIVSALAFALASRIAWRSDPTPLSAVLVTVKVAARAPQVEKVKTHRRAAERLRPARRVGMDSDLSELMSAGGRPGHFIPRLSCRDRGRSA